MSLTSALNTLTERIQTLEAKVQSMEHKMTQLETNQTNTESTLKRLENTMDDMSKILHGEPEHPGLLTELAELKAVKKVAYILASLVLAQIVLEFFNLLLHRSTFP